MWRGGSDIVRYKERARDTEPHLPSAQDTDERRTGTQTNRSSSAILSFTMNEWIGTCFFPFYDYNPDVLFQHFDASCFLLPNLTKKKERKHNLLLSDGVDVNYSFPAVVSLHKRSTWHQTLIISLATFYFFLPFVLEYS